MHAYARVPYKMIFFLCGCAASVLIFISYKFLAGYIGKTGYFTKKKNVTLVYTPAA